MNRALVLFAIFASVILLTQIIPVYAGDSEARKKAKEREEQIAKEVKDKKKKELEAQKKALDPTTVTTTVKDPKGKSAAESTNAARLKVLNDAKTAYDIAKTALETAKKAYKADNTNPTKQTAYNDAKKAFEKAKIAREIAKLG